MTGGLRPPVILCINPVWKLSETYYRGTSVYSSNPLRMVIQSIIFYLLLIDSVSANLISLFGAKWYTKHFRTISRFFPMAEGWALYYLILVLWIGSLIYQAHGLLWVN